MREGIMDTELVLDAHAAIGESPTWSAAEQALYWIDIKAPALHRFDPRARAVRSWSLPAEIGGFALVAGRAQALVALRSGLFLLDLDAGEVSQAAPPPFDPRRHRFNEGACDAAGRFWVGTMFDPLDPKGEPAERAGLFSFTLQGGLRGEPDASELHNGMAWSPDGRTFYLSHSQRGEIFAFEFDARSGRLSGRRSFARIASELGVPDGAAVDEEGGYWCALHGGSRLRRFHSDGRFDRDIALPISQPTMCAFGGPDLASLYVTSAADGLSGEDLRAQPHAGGLFRLTPGAKGLTRSCLVV